VSCGRPFGEQSAVSTDIAPSQRPVSTISAPSPQQAHPTQRRANQGNRWLLNVIPAVLFFIGLAVLARFGWWWPGIMVLIGTVSLLGSAINGQLWAGVQSALWMFGIAVIARFNWWWPGMFILVALSAILGSLARPGRRGW
jgi:hypothetical protein